jgi:hypothetical protein
MRFRTAIAMLGVAVLAAGCGKGKGSYSEGSWGTGKGKGKVPQSAERSMPANAEALKEAMGGYLARPEVRVNGPTFLAISEPIPIKQSQGTAMAYWVQYTATNSYGDQVLGQHDLFILKDGHVTGHYRTTDEIRDKLGTRWVEEHRPPPWPDVVPEKVKRSKE